MGEVWQGYHVDQDVPVAVKVMSTEMFVDDRAHAHFRNEIRAVARLDHPGIAWIFDYGTVDAHSASRSLGRLTAGAPWFAMEFAGHGTLGDLTRGLGWAEIKSTLLELLAALAHAHARGVIHRDLKPANVLIAGPRDLRPGLKLTDFGIAATEASEPTNTDDVIGTLDYMAPEQVRGDNWRQGPHTDLYALGCLAHRLATGSAPFAGRGVVQRMAAQLHQDLPRLPPGEFPGFQEWIDRLTAKREGDRYRFAADAAEALRSLPNTPGGPVVQVPATWRGPRQARSLQLLGAGLGLFGVRTVPLVGRESARDRLWELLSQVHETQRPRVALIRGAAGTGKSRLAEWFIERAHEVGSASSAKALFSEQGAPDAPLRRLVTRLLGVDRIDGEHVEEHELIEAFSSFWRAGVAVENAIRSVLDGNLEASMRHAALRQILETMARKRPLILWLDDVQWGLDGILLARSIIEAAVRPIPVLIVLTARDEALAEREQEGLFLDELLDYAQGTAVGLQPLDLPERSRLVQDLLGLDPALGAAVEERSGGNPLFAIQWIGDWVDRGILVAGENGFQLAEGGDSSLPASLRALWSDRVRRALGGHPPEAQWMLERASILGDIVDPEEWAWVCDDPDGKRRRRGLPISNPWWSRIRRDLVEALSAARLVQLHGSRWSFTHGLLRETLREEAKGGNRWTEHHLAAARMLTDKGDDASQERLGMHLLEGGKTARALQPLIRAIAQRRSRVGPRSAMYLIHRIERVLQAFPDDAPQWALLLEEKAATLHSLGQNGEAREVAGELARRAAQNGWTQAGRAAAFRLGKLAFDALQIRRARQYLEIAQFIRDPMDQARALFTLSRVAMVEQRPRRARALEKKARKVLESSRDPRGKMMAHVFVAEAAWDDDDMVRCGRHARIALEEARRLGDLGIELRCLNFASEAARAAGDFQAAEDDLNAGIRIAETLGHPRAPVLQCNLALVYAAQENFEAADETLQQALLHARQLRHAPTQAVVVTLRLWTTAALGNWLSFNHHATQAERIQLAIPVGEPDCAKAAEHGMELALLAGRPREAERARDLAIDHWTKLGQSERVDAILSRLP